LDERQYQFEWDQIKAAANETKHGVSFELASTVSLTLDCLQCRIWSTADPKSAGFRSA